MPKLNNKKKTMGIGSGIWDSIKYSSIHITDPSGEREGHTIYLKTWAMKQILRTRKLNKMNTQMSTQRHIIKCQKTKKGAGRS